MIMVSGRTLKQTLLAVLMLTCQLKNGVLGYIGCLDNQGNPVDWFVVLKMPELKTSQYDTVRVGVGQLYMDVDNPTLTLLDQGIDEVRGHAIYNTLQQIHDHASDENVVYLMYNDQIEEDGAENSEVEWTNFGQTRGDLCFEHETTGFWLVHSVPQFSAKASKGYRYPKTGHRYGQSFLCVTYGYDQLDMIAQQMLYNTPRLFDQHVPAVISQENPHLAQLVAGGHITNEPWHNKMTLSSLDGQPFTSFAKTAEYGRDLYVWVAVEVESGIYVESLQHHQTAELPSLCNGTYKVINVADLNFLDIFFNESSDHSKWVVTYDSEDNNVCIGDIDREAGQLKRGGGTVCSELPTVANTLRRAVVKTKPCPPGEGIDNNKVM